MNDFAYSVSKIEMVRRGDGFVACGYTIAARLSVQFCSAMK
jgi:hypothetical protein